MGIDRKDVRIVCHFNIPKSMEAFYQESGRAGRDQLPSRSLLYYGMEDRKRMEFILSHAEKKKPQSSTSEDGLSKKSMTDFHQMVEYCEGSGCRRKKILESFGEQVLASLCRKTCDACKHPNLVAKYLEELTTTCAVRQKSSFSQIFVSSSSDMVDDEQFSEFWNRDDEARGSDEDISDSEDDSKVVKSLGGSKLPSNLRLEEKIEFLQRAEESYYQNEVSDRQVKKLNKNGISETLRESSKQRLLNALKQAQQRLGNLEIDMETSACSLEIECYSKYGRAGKSFYYSQVASTVRWLSTSNSSELTTRLGTVTSSTSGDILSKSETPAAPVDHGPTKITCDKFNSTASLETSTCVSPIQNASSSAVLPAIPSFSDFVSGKKAKDKGSDTLQKQLPKISENIGKRMRLQ